MIPTPSFKTASATESPSTAMDAALTAYAAWLSGFIDADAPIGDAGGGTRLITAISELRRAHFPYESQVMSELLVVHTHLTTSIFERELLALRGERPRPLQSSPQFAELLQRQIAAIELLRDTCAHREQGHDRVGVRPPTHRLRQAS